MTCNAPAKPSHHQRSCPARQVELVSRTKSPTLYLRNLKLWPKRSIKTWYTQNAKLSTRSSRSLHLSHPTYLDMTNPKMEPWSLGSLRQSSRSRTRKGSIGALFTLRPTVLHLDSPNQTIRRYDLRISMSTSSRACQTASPLTLLDHTEHSEGVMADSSATFRCGGEYVGTGSQREDLMGGWIASRDASQLLKRIVSLWQRHNPTLVIWSAFSLFGRAA